MFVPTRANVAGKGAVQNLLSHTCLDVTSPKAADMKLRLVPCGSTLPNPSTSEFYMWTKMGQLRIESEYAARCLDSAERGDNKPVSVYPCHGQRGNQEFEYTPKLQIRHVASKSCLTVMKEKRNSKIVYRPVMSACKYGGEGNAQASPLQRWSFSKWHDY